MFETPFQRSEAQATLEGFRRLQEAEAAFQRAINGVVGLGAIDESTVRDLKGFASDCLRDIYGELRIMELTEELERI